ncbi:MAG: M20/M25/M40 family metallo-hydrolase [Anaerolineaceae bacterium]|nr:M20/M25/M40 family metallo-hydrolase [Anaerolineaceae bacterium]
MIKKEEKMTLEIGSQQIALLERLSNAAAVSGDEGAVRRIVLEEIEGAADSLRVDAMGSVLAVRHAQSPNALRVMVAAHMDEIGFMLLEETGDGLFHFGLVGGIDPRQLPGKPVWVGPARLPGVIGACPVHLSSEEERSKIIPVDDLRIDIGPAQAGKVEPGAWAVFATGFRQVGPSLFGKALDDRLGVATLIELFKHAPPNIELLAAFTVQEEVGLRGAGPAADALQPDLAFVIDCTPALDHPNWDGSENVRYNTQLDRGPAIYTADAATISDRRLIRHLRQTAAAEGIPCQLRQPGGGGTDAGAIHVRREGIPSVSMSVPGRYMHTAISMVRLADWQHYAALLYAALRQLPPDILEEER